MKDGRWNAAKLLELSDLVRLALSKGRKLTSAEVEDLNFVLDIMIVDELDDELPSQRATSSASAGGGGGGHNTTQKVTFSTIQRARLDKLLTDMLRAHDKEITAVPIRGKMFETGLGSEIDTATSLQRHWYARSLCTGHHPIARRDRLRTLQTLQACLVTETLCSSD